VKDQQQIESILQHIQNDIYYPNLLEKTVHMFFSMVKFYCFNDGNKRTSVVCIYIFLQENGVFIDDLYVKLEDIVVGVADGSLDKEYLKKYFKTLFHSF
jgi:death-on-curing protein